MGTSTPFGGGSGKNPLIPTWLDDSDGAAPAAVPPSDGPANGTSSDNDAVDGSPPPSDGGTISPLDNRFKQPRTSFNKFARSGGSDRRNLGRAVASYVSRAGGGSKIAARRMSSDRAAAGRLGTLLSEAGQSGIREVLRTLNLDALADRSIPEIYASLVDVVCAPGGDLDEAFPRDAYLEAVAEVLDMDLADMEKPSPETIVLIMERFIANTIRARILNAIGNQVITLPKNVATVKAIDIAFREFVRGAVSDALNEVGRVLNSAQMKTITDSLYDRSLSVLQVYAEAMAEECP